MTSHFDTVTVHAHAHDVLVETYSMSNKNGPPAVKVVARFGETVVEMSHSTMSMDGASFPDSAHVQRGLNSVRLKAAQLAVVREELRKQLAEVK